MIRPEVVTIGQVRDKCQSNTSSLGEEHCSTRINSHSDLAQYTLAPVDHGP
jgi:hypothetical protein